MTTVDSLHSATVAHGAALLAVVDTARRAGALQWESPRGPSREPNDRLPMPGSRPADPTGETACDGRRLKLRGAYLAAVGDIEAATHRLRVAERLLLEALAPYGENDAPIPLAA